MIQAEAGYINRTWADALVIGMLYNNHYKEFQTGNNQNIVYGKVNRHGNYFMPSLRYKKTTSLLRDSMRQHLSVMLSTNIAW
ncbi:hypothetical protein KUH03_32215 [Sphingobacterium sp. E70]|uniref:hypothetical protein n=1 Tax=Sphingobacterium sp. E70 TaxID=2853439 RepID=UPI00211BDF7E|nr:hypothetical protein [Sphingobacterium sp. E70]ULT23766.1 hypothetical protein KUH03_32215 [Sphingobacterium sp. E70]